MGLKNTYLLGFAHMVIKVNYLLLSFVGVWNKKMAALAMKNEENKVHSSNFMEEEVHI